MGGSVIETTGGKVSGTLDQGVHVFRGIPYGSPPVGRLRFRPPVPARRWDGVLDAAGYPPSCPQGIGSRAPGPEAEELRSRAAVFGMAMAQERQDEACLSLNVWTPGTHAGGERPVMFRIHGGGYSSGSGSSPWHVGTNLCLRGDVVVVTMNHRLGVLGFLHLEGLGGEAWSGSGNAGMLDLVLALEWVRDNIAAFGGDPDNVTIFGESGGGMKTSTLLAMPAARGLFHRAIVQSGPQLRVREPAAATELSGRLLAEVGVAPQRLDDLADVPVQELLDAQLRLIGPGASLGFGPVLDGSLLPAHPVDALRTGTAADVPVLVGWTRHEASMFWWLEGAPELDDDGLHRRLHRVLGESTDAAIAEHRRLHPEATPTWLYLLIQSTIMFGTGSLELATAKVSGSTTPTYAYLMAWHSPVEGRRLGAAHGMCVPLSMDNAHSAPYSDVPAGHALAATMSEAWLSFARTGVPGHAGLPEWPAFTGDRPAVMVFDERCEVVVDPFAAERAALAGSTFRLG
jgi:para-nitrobenzyl esterase